MMSPSILFILLILITVFAGVLIAVLIIQRDKARRMLMLSEQEMDALQQTRKQTLVREGSLTVTVNRLEKQTAELTQARTTLQKMLREKMERIQQMESMLHQYRTQLEEKSQTVSRQWAGIRLQKGLIEQAKMALGVLGVELGAKAQDPLAAGHRRRSRLALAELLAEAGVDTVALVDDRGLSLLGAGQNAEIERLARFGGLAAEARAAFEPALGAPLLQWSLETASRGVHLLSLGEHCWLALSGDPQAPQTAMLMTCLKLIGQLPEHSNPVEHLFIDEQPSTQDWPTALVALTDEWRHRWQARSVVIVESTGQILSASPGQLPRNLQAARQTLRDLHIRLDRDGWDLQDVELSVRASHHASVTARLLDENADAPAVMVFAEERIPMEGLDELYASLRWSLSRPHTLAAG